MKKLIYLLFFSCFLMICISCEKEATNPGDFNQKCTLDVYGISTTSGNEYEFEITRSIDSTYMRYYIEPDTLRGEDGEPLKDDFGKLIIENDTIHYPGNITGRFVEVGPILLKPNIDTISIHLRSNAKWSAPMPDAGGRVQWFFTQRLGGGGDSKVIATVTRNRNKRRAVSAVQYVLTPDSAVLYKITFDQSGEND